MGSLLNFNHRAALALFFPNKNLIAVFFFSFFEESIHLIFFLTLEFKSVYEIKCLFKVLNIF